MKEIINTGQQARFKTNLCFFWTGALLQVMYRNDPGENTLEQHSSMHHFYTGFSTCPKKAAVSPPDKSPTSPTMST